MRGAVLLAAGIALMALMLAASAGAATIKVTEPDDDFSDVAGDCSLREAVQAANENANFGGCERVGPGGADTIKLLGGESYTRTRAGGDDTNETGDLDVTGKTTIEVRGEGKATIDAGSLDRVLEVREGARLTGSRLVLVAGVVPSVGGHSGGGIYSQGRLVLRSSSVTSNGGPGTNAMGGGIAGRGNTSLRRVSVTSNVTSGSAPGGGVGQFGGSLTISKSTIAGNDASSGGGLYLAGDAEVTITASTISQNEALGESDGGGGIFASDGAEPAAPARLTNVTITGNDSNTRGGGIYASIAGGALRLNAVTVTDNTADANANGAGTIGGAGGGLHGDITYKNSIVFGNTATTENTGDCFNASSAGHNVTAFDTGCDAFETTDAGLDDLEDNGGPTATHALLQGSPAIGRAGDSAPPKDQRGVKRDANPDAGSFER